MEVNYQKLLAEQDTIYPTLISNDPHYNKHVGRVWKISQKKLRPCTILTK